MNFAKVRDITIPEGELKRITCGGVTLWERAYLEITPTVVWLSPSALNDVLSNTNWQIN